MNFYSIGSKIVLIIISLLLVYIAISLSQSDHWPLELFDPLLLFSLIISTDFMFYELFCSNISGKNHLAFCVFPLTRYNVLILEIKYYLKRWEILIFMASVLFYIGYFYLISNSEILPMLIILFLYSAQLIFVTCFLFIIKNFLSMKNFNVNIKNMLSAIISVSVILASLAGKIKIVNFIYHINPLTCGFLSYLLGKPYGILGFVSVLSFSLLLVILVKKKFREWPLY